MKHILKKIFLILFLPCLLISCSCSRGEYVDLPPFNQDYGLVYSEYDVINYVDYQAEYHIDEVIRSFYGDTNIYVWNINDAFVQKKRLYGTVSFKEYQGEKLVMVYSAFYFDFLTENVSELFRYDENELIEIIHEKVGYEVGSIEDFKKANADIDNIDFYFSAKLDEQRTMRVLEIILDINSYEVIYFDKYIEEQKNYYDEMKKRLGVTYGNDSDIKTPFYTKDGKTFTYDDDFLLQNSDVFELILKRAKYEKLKLKNRMILLRDGKLFLKMNYHKYSIAPTGEKPDLVFEIELNTGYATYLGLVPPNAKLMGVIKYE